MEKNDKIKAIAVLVVGMFLTAVGLAGMIFYAVAMSMDVFEFFPPIYLPVVAMFLLVVGVIMIFIVGTAQKRKNTKKIIDMQNESLKIIQSQLIKTCPYCDSKVQAGSSFCVNCGKSVVPIVCHKCGQINSNDSTYCKSCGEKLKKLS